MAAITTTHPNYNRVLPHPANGSVTIQRTFSSQLFGEAGDILKIGPLARGRWLGPGCAVAITDVDTDGSPSHVFSLEVTDGTTTKTVIDGSTAGQAGGLARPTKIPTTEDGVGFIPPSENFHVRLICDTAAATEAAGTITVYLEIHGHRDNQLTE